MFWKLITYLPKIYIISLKIPGEGFVAAAKHNEQVTKTALKAFKEKMLMFPMPMRQYLWEDYIYSSKGQKKPKV